MDSNKNSNESTNQLSGHMAPGPIYRKINIQYCSQIIPHNCWSKRQTDFYLATCKDGSYIQ